MSRSTLQGMIYFWKGRRPEPFKQRLLGSLVLKTLKCVVCWGLRAPGRHISFPYRYFHGQKERVRTSPGSSLFWCLLVLNTGTLSFRFYCIYIYMTPYFASLQIVSDSLTYFIKHLCGGRDNPGIEYFNYTNYCSGRFKLCTLLFGINNANKNMRCTRFLLPPPPTI